MDLLKFKSFKKKKKTATNILPVTIVDNYFSFVFDKEIKIENDEDKNQIIVNFISKIKLAILEVLRYRICCCAAKESYQFTYKNFK